jgi:hypothetical protein
MIDTQAPFLHDFFEIARAERRPEIPTDAQQNDLCFKMTLFEWACVTILLLFSLLSRNNGNVGIVPSFHSLKMDSCLSLYAPKESVCNGGKETNSQQHEALGRGNDQGATWAFQDSGNSMGNKFWPWERTLHLGRESCANIARLNQ